ncbi:hypothetical protein CsatB_024575 [Cannabis sativa]|uniref:Uncharacterized protein n=1 Tax=Cannabis sativa TaxID=3483 RepID=A0A7J6DXA4_CANSA|nr:hypothetical protein F8388_017644 [Cannabis sativa]KAF4393242.1 hypothetical protein G4B88_001976 [Cannabis sativa]
MITRSKLVEQLREYQIRSQQKFSPLTVFSSKPNPTSRYDVAVAIIWALVFTMLVVSSYLALHFKHFRLSVFIFCLGVFLLLRLRISRHTLARRSRERKMLLPLSM